MLSRLPRVAFDRTTRSMLRAELLRREAFRALRRAFVQQCARIRKQKKGVLSCFAKWHFSLLRRVAGKASDPLLPTNARRTCQRVCEGDCASDTSPVVFYTEASVHLEFKKGGATGVVIGAP